MQLRQIAEAHNGRIPLHGRLFAQWLHYAFPRECPFPHKTGLITQQTTSERESDMLVTEDEVHRYAAGRDDSLPTSDESEVMAQWSEDEELIGDFSMHTANIATWEVTRIIYVASFAVLGLLIALFATSQGM